MKRGLISTNTITQSVFGGGSVVGVAVIPGDVLVETIGVGIIDACKLLEAVTTAVPSIESCRENG